MRIIHIVRCKAFRVSMCIWFHVNRYENHFSDGTKRTGVCFVA